MHRSHILVVGGAGYIGSHMVWLLGQRGVQVTVLDNLSTGHRDAVLHGRLIEGDMADAAWLDSLFAQHRFDAVMHFASCIQVAESVTDPAKYLPAMQKVDFKGVSGHIAFDTKGDIKEGGVSLYRYADGKWEPLQ